MSQDLSSDAGVIGALRDKYRNHVHWNMPGNVEMLLLRIKT